MIVYFTVVAPKESGGFVDDRPAQRVRRFDAFFMPGRWSSAIPAAVGTAVAARPAVMLAFNGSVDARGGCGGGAKVGKLV
jgi:hypothetical protein